MLSQNSVARLLSGAAEVLDADVAPRIEDGFARMQAKAVAELLANLAERVDWTPAERLADARDSAELLAAAGAPVPEPVPDDRDRLHAAVVAAIAGLDAAPDARREAVEAVLREQSVRHARGLRSTMYRQTPSPEQAA